MATNGAPHISAMTDLSEGELDEEPDTAGREELRPLLFPEHGTLSSSNGVSEVLLDRKNEFYNLKRFVLLSFGIPGIPAMKRQRNIICTIIAVPFYIILATLGFTLVVISTFVDGPLWRLHCPQFLVARIFTMQAGLLYMLLGVYWLLLFWWHKHYQANRQAHHKNFSIMALLWCVLCIYFTVVATGLAFQVIQFRNLIFNTGESKANNFVACSTPSDNIENDVIHVPNNIMPAWALGSMLLLLLVNVCTFVANAISLWKP